MTLHITKALSRQDIVVHAQTKLRYEQDLKAFDDGLGNCSRKLLVQENASTILVDMLSCAELGYNDLISVLECGIAADLALASQTAKEKLNTDSDSNYDQYALYKLDWE